MTRDNYSKYSKLSENVCNKTSEGLFILCRLLYLALSNDCNESSF